MKGKQFLVTLPRIELNIVLILPPDWVNTIPGYLTLDSAEYNSQSTFDRVNTVPGYLTLDWLEYNPESTSFSREYLSRLLYLYLSQI